MDKTIRRIQQYLSLRVIQSLSIKFEIFPIYVYLTVGATFVTLMVILFVIHLSTVSYQSPITLHSLKSHIPDESQSGDGWHEYCTEWDVSNEIRCIRSQVYQLEGLFSQIRVEFIDDKLVKVDYEFREATVKLGHLIVLWGEPKFVQARHIINLYWKNGSITAQAKIWERGFSPFMPIVRIIVSSKILDEPTLK